MPKEFLDALLKEFSLARKRKDTIRSAFETFLAAVDSFDEILGTKKIRETKARSRQKWEELKKKKPDKPNT
jgi:hypothetical protein